MHMTNAPKMKPALRINTDNPDHHIYNNNGVWWIHYTLHLADYTAQRVRESLSTRDLNTARLRRDLYLNGMMMQKGAA